MENIWNFLYGFKPNKCVCVGGVGGERERSTPAHLFHPGDSLQFTSWTCWIGMRKKVSAAQKKKPSFTNKLVHDDNRPLGCVAVQANRNVPFIRRENPENSKPVLQTHRLEHLRNIEIL